MQKSQTIAFFTLGCKLNYAETMSYAKLFEKYEFKKVGFNQVADVYLINSCAVTSSAGHKSELAIKRCYKNNPQSVIIITGCFAEVEKEALLKNTKATYVLNLKEKNTLESIIESNFILKIPDQIKQTKKSLDFQSAYNTEGRTRSFLKIQDGCDYFCTYCIIPFTRGRSRSPSINSLMQQVDEIYLSGIKEIVLTGVNIGDFGKSTGENFEMLIKTLSEYPKNIRIRLGSIEPNLLSYNIIKMVKDSPNLMPHFHIPLQSGSNDMLKLMQRKYKRELFQDKVLKIKQLLPHAFIGVDLIVGVSGETESMFQETYDFINKLPISFIHVFTYSERPGTKAIDFTPVVPHKIRKQRSEIMHKLSESKQQEFYKSMLEHKSKVLWESYPEKGMLEGFTENYIRAVCENNKLESNSISNVVLESIIENGKVLVKTINNK